MLGLFDGLGWTAVAAANTGRTAVTVERDTVQMEVARTRVSDSDGTDVVGKLIWCMQVMTAMLPAPSTPALEAKEEEVGVPLSQGAPPTDAMRAALEAARRFRSVLDKDVVLDAAAAAAAAGAQPPSVQAALEVAERELAEAKELASREGVAVDEAGARALADAMVNEAQMESVESVVERARESYRDAAAKGLAQPAPMDVDVIPDTQEMEPPGDDEEEEVDVEGDK